MFGHMRRRSANAQSDHHPASGPRRRHVPHVAAGKSSVQHGSVPGRLRGQRVESRVDSMHGIVRRWQFHQHSHHHHSFCQWRRAVSCVDANPIVQHPSLRHQLRRVGVVWVVCLFGHLRWWHAIGDAVCVGGRRQRWCRVSGADDATILQCAGVSRRLPGQSLVRLERMFHQLRWWHSNQYPQRDDGRCQWWCRVPGVGDDPDLQYASVSS